MRNPKSNTPAPEGWKGGETADYIRRGNIAARQAMTRKQIEEQQARFDERLKRDREYAWSLRVNPDRIGDIECQEE